MKVEINETGKKNIVYLGYEDIISQAEEIFEDDFNGWTAESFILDIKEYGADVPARIALELREFLDRLTLLRNVYKNLDWYINGLLLEYCRKHWYYDFIMWNYKVTWVENQKSRQNIVSMIKENDYKLVEGVWEKIKISSTKFYDKLNATDFPIGIAEQMLKENGFVRIWHSESLNFEYTKNVNGLDLNLGMDFVYTDLRETFAARGVSYIEGLITLRSYLSDMEDAYDYIKGKFAKMDDDYLLEERFHNGHYVLSSKETNEIIPVNDSGLTFLEIISDSNILSESELIDIIWSRSKLWTKDAIEYNEDEVIISKWN